MRRNTDDEPFYEQGLPDEEQKKRPELELTKEEKRLVALGALKSGLLIALVYIIGGAVLIWLMLFFWT